MKKIGLALSGGGFRATLYHLGLVRFLHDAGILSNVSHITAVSGGSIIAAHLGLNWSRYNGSADEFDAAALELLAFIRLDVRNRILRRFPLAFALRVPRRLAGLPNRKLTRTGLLEYHYEKYLYGDTSLFQLPESPCLHLLATNLSEGRLCSFSRDGLWMIHRGEGHTVRIEQISIGLATIPMAVAASSAFPAFFPPIVLTGADVGARGGEFGRKAFTDGGVFDNLGIRMFHCLAQASATDQLPWDAIVVSDAGRPFEIQNMRASGLIRTAMRASDILMDRVWQLETQTFRDTPGFLFARITKVVDPEEDPTALHPEVQRQLQSIRTDLDRFSHVEISSLVRHGYCVGRKTCRARPDLFGTELPEQLAWDPTLAMHATTNAAAEAPTVFLPRREPTALTPRARTLHAWAPPRIRSALLDYRDQVSRLFKARAATSAGPEVPTVVLPPREPTPVTVKARTLHASAAHRVWSTLLDYRDWASYIYVPIILPILVLLPYLVMEYYERSQRINQIVSSLAQESRDLEQMIRLLDGPAPPFIGNKAQDISLDVKTDLQGFLILQDLRIIDLRQWNPEAGGKDANSNVYGYRRLKVRKLLENNSNNSFRVNVLAISPATQVRFPPQQLPPKLYARDLTTYAHGQRLRRFEIGADFHKVPPGQTVDIVYEHRSPGLFLRSGIDSTSLAFEVEAETSELSRWMLLPQGREYRTFELIRYPTARPLAPESVKPDTQYLASNFKILAFKLLALKAGYTYELTWFYR